MRLKDIIRKINEKEILLPNFQRDFVWDRDQQKQLVASVICNIPSSSCLVVEQKENENSFRCKEIGFSIGEVQPERTSFSYLLDGQQRFTTLYFAFNDRFNSTSTENNKVYNSIYPLLHNRWFLQLENISNEEAYLFSLDTLIWDKKKADEYLPDSIYPFIVCKKDIKKADKFYRINQEEAAQKLSQHSPAHNYIPLQLILSNDSYKLQSILKHIAEKRRNELINNLGNEKVFLQVIPALEAKGCKPQEVEDYRSTFFSDGNLEEKQAKKNQLEEWYDDLIDEWSGQFKEWLTDTISGYSIQPIKLQSIHKAIDTFQYINIGGTNLSTFDLLCAKCADFNLRQRVFDTLNTNLKFYDESFTEFRTSDSISSDIGIITGNTLSRTCTDYIFQTLNFCWFIENNKRLIQRDETTKRFQTSILKQNFALNNISKEFVEEHIDTVTIAIKKAFCLIHFHCGHADIKQITNKLSLLPIIFIYQQYDNLSIRQTQSLIGFFWLRLLTGAYDKHQNEQCVIDTLTIFKNIPNSESMLVDNLGVTQKDDNSADIEIPDDFMNKEEFCTKYMLCQDSTDLNRSFKTNLLLFLRSQRNYKDWLSNTNLNTDSPQEIHHIIPVATASNIERSSKDIRRDKSNPLNVLMNQTYISKDSNREIRAYTLSEYRDRMLPQTMVSHCIPENWKDLDFRNATNNEYKVAFEARWEMIKNALISKLNEYLDL